MACPARGLRLAKPVPANGPAQTLPDAGIHNYLTEATAKPCEKNGKQCQPVTAWGASREMQISRLVE